MHETLTSGPGHSSYLLDPPATTHFSGAVVNVIVAGHRKWEPDRIIKRVWFGVPHIKELLANQAKLKSLRAYRRPSESAGTSF
jgi:hypothetical protein